MITTDQSDQPGRRRRRGGSAFLIGLGATVVAGLTLVSLQNVEVDLDSGSIRYLDPETGDPLTSFPMEDVIAAQTELVTIGPGDGMRYGVFAFTSDGKEWTIQSFDDMGSGETVIHLAVTDTHVVAGAMDLAAFYNPSSPPGFNVWTAAIP